MADLSVTELRNALREDLNTALKPINEKLGTLSSEVGTLRNEVGTLSSEVGTLRNELGITNEEVARIHVELVEIKDTQDSHTASLLKIEQTLTSYADAYKLNQDNIKKHDKRVTKIEKHLNLPSPENL